MLTLRITAAEDKQRVPIPCSRSDIDATEHLMSPLRDSIHACDGDTDSFYHSVAADSGRRHSPYFTVQFDNTYSIETITVVNVHTGVHCNNDPRDCTGRIDGAKVEVLTASMFELVIKKNSEFPDYAGGWDSSLTQLQY